MINFVKIGLCVSIIFSINYTNAQTYTIDQGGTIVTCSGDFFDSDNAGNYQNNENYTMTFCSNGGGNIINAGFATLFDIDPSDTLYVYDGNTTAAPLIGKYNNGNVPAGISSTTANTTACLTFQFISDGVSTTTGWSATFNCATICQPINPIVTTTPASVSYAPDSNYTNICPGDTVLFSASGAYPNNGANSFSYAQSDATSTFDWALGTGNVANTQNTSEFYTAPQGYLVLLTITDAFGCIETVRHRVRTGIPPVFSGIYPQPDTACFGDTVNLIGGFNQTTGSSVGVSLDTGVVSAGGTITGQTFLPDGSGASYSTSVNIAGFPSQNIVNGTDISQVCLNIEHSYIGDLTIDLSCPNGTTITLSNTFGGTGNGGTFLGDALDDGTTNPGVGMDYCFDMGAAWGTMDAENNASNWIPSTITPGNNILTPGNFQPDQSFNGLIGCPIDGNWTITVTDNIGLDNGYIFEWSILLNPAINPNAEFYTVDLINGVWLPDPDIVNYYDTLALTVPNGSGVFPYTFQVTDDFGCTFDTIVEVFVLNELNPIASPDTIICLGDTINLNVNIVDTCSYTLQLDDSWGDGWNGAVITLSINGTPFLNNITVPNCGGAGCTSTFTIPVTTGDVITMNYTAGSFNSENDVTLFDASGAIIYTVNNPPNGNLGGNIIAVCGAFVDYLWSPATSLSDPTIKDPIFNGTTTNYNVTLTYANFPQCSATSDTITVEVKDEPDPLILGDSVVCIGFEINLEGINGTLYTWPDNSTNSTVNFIPNADTTVTLIASNFCDTFTVTKNIIVNPNPIVTTGPDTSIVIQDSVVLYVIGGATGVNYNWTPPNYLDCPTCPNPIATPVETTTYTVEITDTNGCISSGEITVEVLIPDLFIPTGFSPNNDGVNDVVFVRSLDIEKMVLQIYDRWGQLVFEAKDQETGWDGTHHGKELDFGVYIYKFEATLLGGQKIEQSGSITLFR